MFEKNGIEEWRKKYELLINFRKRNPCFGEAHKHHIFPKSIYGNNSKTVKLTKFEHCVAHFFLTRIFKFSKVSEYHAKMKNAFWGLYFDLGYNGSLESKTKFLEDVEKLLTEIKQHEKSFRKTSVSDITRHIAI